MLNYKVQAENNSLYNTPNTFGVYILGLTLKWLQAQGGLAAVGAVNERKAQRLYAEIDRTGFYRGTAQPESRSLMNVTFRLPSEELEKAFDKQATADGLDGLKGHRRSAACAPRSTTRSRKTAWTRSCSSCASSNARTDSARSAAGRSAPARHR